MLRSLNNSSENGGIDEMSLISWGQRDWWLLPLLTYTYLGLFCTGDGICLSTPEVCSDKSQAICVEVKTLMLVVDFSITKLDTHHATIYSHWDCRRDAE